MGISLELSAQQTTIWRDQNLAPCSVDPVKIGFQYNLLPRQTVDVLDSRTVDSVG